MKEQLKELGIQKICPKTGIIGNPTKSSADKGKRILDLTSRTLKKIIDENALGVLLSCVSPENFENNLKELKSLNIPFGFKLNGFVTTKLRES